MVRQMHPQITCLTTFTISERVQLHFSAWVIKSAVDMFNMLTQGKIRSTKHNIRTTFYVRKNLTT